MLRQYRIDSVIGQGGFGITYLAYDTDLQRRVAVKECYPRDFVAREGTTVVPTGASEKKDFSWALGKFVDEATTLARFKHPGIVQVLQILKDENQSAYIVLEFVDGQSFDQWLKAQPGPPDEASLKQIIAPLMDALEVVHDNNIAHRDIAPDNIYIRKDGTAVLLDFGAAKQTLSQQSRTLNLVVKDGYSAPEQYYAEGRQGPWTDVYAFAATLYRAISGKRPVDAMARLDALNNDEPDPLEPLSALASAEYSPGFLSAIADGLAPQTKVRPQSLKAWRPSLLGSVPPTATAAPEIGAADKTRVQKPASGTAGGSKTPPRQKSGSLAWILAGVAVLVLGGAGGYVLVQQNAAQAETRAWETVVEQDTVAAYRNFVDNYPSSELLSSAQQAIRALNQPWTRILDGASTERANAVAVSPNAIIVAGGTLEADGNGMQGLVQSITMSGRDSWRVSHGGPGIEVFEGALLTRDGDIIAVGHSKETTTSDQKGLVVRYGPDGKQKWARLIGAQGNHNLMDAVFRDDGNIALAGSAESGPNGGMDGWIVTLNPFGDVLSEQFLGGAGDDGFEALAAMPDGGIALVGHKQRKGGSDANFWLVKLAADGSVRLDRTPGGTGTDTFKAVAAKPDGQLVVVGQTDSFGSNTVDGMIMRVTADNKTPPKVLAEERDDYLTGVVVAPDGDIVVAGYTSSRGAGQTDGWVIKYDRNLSSVIWERVVGGKGWDTIQDLEVLPDGSTVLVGSSGKDGSGGSDVWILRLGSDGLYDGS